MECVTRLVCWETELSKRVKNKIIFLAALSCAVVGCLKHGWGKCYK